MPGRIRQDCLERIRDAVDIVALVSGYVTLKKSGTNHKGLCPFHQEKSPSFHVSSQRRIYKCFGCGEAGNVFDFVMAMDKVTFPEAAEVLADRAGIPLEFEASTFTPSVGPAKPDLFRVNRWAAEFFRRQLYAPIGTECRRYLEKRGLSDETCRMFGLGYAPDGWDALLNASKKSGVPLDALESAGLVKARDDKSGHYDRFRNRLIFPIRDAMDRVIAFGARSLDGSEPKYLNSPETPIFSKGRCLYGIEYLRHLETGRPAYVMEGYTDVMMAYQEGCRGAVATLGTALTEHHATLLGRYTQNVVLLYDGDAAGRRAAERGVGLFLAADLDFKVARLEGNEDPCDFFRRTGEKGVDILAGATMDFLEYVLAETAARHEVSTVTGKARAADELLEISKKIVNPVKRGSVVERIAQVLQLSSKDLLARLSQSKRPVFEAPRAVEEMPAKPVAAPEVMRAQKMAEETVVRQVLNTPGPWPWLARVQPHDFLVPAHRELMEGIFAAEGTQRAVDVDELMLGLSDSAMRTYLVRMIGETTDEPERLREKLEGDLKYLSMARTRGALDQLRKEGVRTDQDLLELTRRRKELMTKKEIRPESGPAPISAPKPPAVPQKSQVEDVDTF